MKILSYIGAAMLWSALALTLFFLINVASTTYRITPEILKKAVSSPEKQAFLDLNENHTANYFIPSTLSEIRDKMLFAQKKSEAAGDDWSKRWSNYDVQNATFWAAKYGSPIQGKAAQNWLWALLVLIITGSLLFFLPQYSLALSQKNNHVYHDSTKNRGLIGWGFGVLMIGFYIILYWFPQYLAGFTNLFDGLAFAMSGGAASQWFLYGTLYTLAVWVMGLRMAIKYRDNKYQLLRTGSVVFFQTVFAFILSNLLSKFHLPYAELHKFYPLDYSFFYDYHLQELTHSGSFGLFLLVWGIVGFLVIVPLFTYFFGKRWYCSWVCGCGGLAETLGDPFRQLSDKSLNAWKIERYSIHFVMVFVSLMTLAVLYNYFTGGFGTAFALRDWYGFLIGSVFSGVVGTGFYPLMGNRVWCRFGCPLAAYMGLIQRFQSRFRITTNGGQCISCGNCSTYCEQGIDVRAYAQRGQDIVRASCVGCGVCASVCPRGVLRLENGSDIKDRATATRTIHVRLEDVKRLS
jgi:ferredoxin-type protein NapH